MAILITGGCGYIGSHTCVEMLAAGYDIVVVDNYYNSKPEALKRVKELSGKDVPGGHSVFTVRFEVKNVAELEVIRNKLLNIRDVLGSRRGQN